VLKTPLPTWVVEGRVTILNPEDGNTLPITSNEAPSGANGVWQFAVNETLSGNDASSCVSNVKGTAVVIGSNSSNVGHFDWVSTTDARFSTQDFPRNFNLTHHYVQDRVMVRNDFASCMVTGKPGQAMQLDSEANFKLGTSDTPVAYSQQAVGSNSSWLIQDMVYPSQVTNAIGVTLSLTPSNATRTGNSDPAPMVVSPQKSTMICTKKVGKLTYKATVKWINPKCPSGYKFQTYLPSDN